MPSHADRPRRILIGLRVAEALSQILQGISAYIRQQGCRWEVRCVDAEEFSRLLQRGTLDGAVSTIPSSRGDLISEAAGERGQEERAATWKGYLPAHVRHFHQLRTVAASRRCRFAASPLAAGARTIARVANLDIDQILSWLIPDPADCRREAQELRLSDPNATAEELARKAVKDSRKWAAAIGGATGAAANPITMLPAAVADMAAMLKLEGTLAGTIAALLDPDSLDDGDTFRKEIFRVVFPGAVSQALRKVGIRAGEQATKNVVRKLVGREAAKDLGERVAKLLGIRLTEKAITTKAVPLIGAGIGAAWNFVEIQAVGHRAIGYHLGLDSPGARARKRVASIVRDARKKLPRRNPRE